VVLSRGVCGRGGSAAVASNDLCGVLPGAADGDSPGLFLSDLLAAGDGVNDDALARALAVEAGDRVAELAGMGVSLLLARGEPDRVRAPGHSASRSYRVAPLTGKPPGVALTLPLRATAEASGVVCLDRRQVTELLVSEERAVGARAVDTARGRSLVYSAAAVILATGGGAYLYECTNATSEVAGDGYALALGAGAELRDMEFVQFHPTRMDTPVSRMLTEGLIDDGAVLRNRFGEEFMCRYHPDGNMAPRDARSRAIYSEIRSGGGLAGYLLLDCSRIPPERLRLRHSGLTDLLRRRGVDFPVEPLRVYPAAHFFMGGVAIDAEGRTSVAGLYACGEVAGGVHGADRLGSTAYSEALVFGARAGLAAAEYAASRPAAGLPRGLSLGAGAVPASRSTAVAETWRELRSLMWRHAGLLRSADGLGAALRRLTELRAVTHDDASLPTSDGQAASLHLALTTAEAVVRCALSREESRGAHWRADYPNPVQAWRGSLFLSKSGREWTLRFRPSDRG
jgi:aspartate oxidase